MLDVRSGIQGGLSCTCEWSYQDSTGQHLNIGAPNPATTIWLSSYHAGCQEWDSRRLVLYMWVKLSRLCRTTHEHRSPKSCNNNLIIILSCWVSGVGFKETYPVMWPKLSGLCRTIHEHRSPESCNNIWLSLSSYHAGCQEWDSRSHVLYMWLKLSGLCRTTLENCGSQSCIEDLINIFWYWTSGMGYRGMCCSL